MNTGGQGRNHPLRILPRALRSAKLGGFRSTTFSILARLASPKSLGAKGGIEPATHGFSGLTDFQVQRRIWVFS